MVMDDATATGPQTGDGGQHDDDVYNTEIADVQQQAELQEQQKTEVNMIDAAIAGMEIANLNEDQANQLTTRLMEAALFYPKDLLPDVLSMTQGMRPQMLGFVFSGLVNAGITRTLELAGADVNEVKDTFYNMNSLKQTKEHARVQTRSPLPNYITALQLNTTLNRMVVAANQKACNEEQQREDEAQASQPLPHGMGHQPAMPPAGWVMPNTESAAAMSSMQKTQNDQTKALTELMSTMKDTMMSKSSSSSSAILVTSLLQKQAANGRMDIAEIAEALAADQGAPKINVAKMLEEAGFAKLAYQNMPPRAMISTLQRAASQGEELSGQLPAFPNIDLFAKQNQAVCVQAQKMTRAQTPSIELYMRSVLTWLMAARITKLLTEVDVFNHMHVMLKVSQDHGVEGAIKYRDLLMDRISAQTLLDGNSKCAPTLLYDPDRDIMEDVRNNTKRRAPDQTDDSSKRGRWGGAEAPRQQGGGGGGKSGPSGSRPPHAAGSTVCRDYQVGKCKRGASCKFQHVCEACGTAGCWKGNKKCSASG
jgi:hypothetical protein